MRASALLPRPIPNVSYAVAFFIPSATPFQVLDLSYVLLRFMDRYIRDGDYTRFNLLSLTYKLGPTGSLGVLLFDRHLRTAYRQTRLKARSSTDRFVRRFEWPISTWPDNGNDRELNIPVMVVQLMRNTRYFRLFQIYVIDKLSRFQTPRCTISAQPSYLMNPNVRRTLTHSL